MKNLFRNGGSILVGAACASLAIPAFGQVAYDSMTLQSPATWSLDYFSMVGSSASYPGATVVGNQIDLATGSQVLSSFSFNYYGMPPGGVWNNSLQYEITLYNNNGTPTTIGTSTYNAPGTTILTSGPFNLVNPGFAGGNLVVKLNAGVDFPSGIVVPSEFTWGLSILNANSADTVGLNFFPAPSVGNAFNDYWIDTASGWVLEKNTTAGETSVFGAQVTVVPEPTTLVLALFGGLGLVVARRIRK